MAEEGSISPEDKENGEDVTSGNVSTLQVKPSTVNGNQDNSERISIRSKSENDLEQHNEQQNKANLSETVVDTMSSRTASDLSSGLSIALKPESGSLIAIKSGITGSAAKFTDAKYILSDTIYENPSETINENSTEHLDSQANHGEVADRTDESKEIKRESTDEKDNLDDRFIEKETKHEVEVMTNDINNPSNKIHDDTEVVNGDTDADHATHVSADIVDAVPKLASEDTEYSNGGRDGSEGEDIHHLNEDNIEESNVDQSDTMAMETNHEIKDSHDTDVRHTLDQGTTSEMQINDLVITSQDPTTQNDNLIDSLESVAVQNKDLGDALEPIGGEIENVTDSAESVAVQNENVTDALEPIGAENVAASTEPAAVDTKNTVLDTLTDRHKIPDAPPLQSDPKSTEEDTPLEPIVTDRLSLSPLRLSWSFGWNRNVPILSLGDEQSSQIIYASAHVIVIYDYLHNTQILLQGHSDMITDIFLSKDKKWLASADAGEECIVLIWDVKSRFPVQTLFKPSENGILAVAFNENSRYLVTISGGPIQTVAIWEWTLSDCAPVCSADLLESYGLQNYIRFNPENDHLLVSNSENQVIFYFWESNQIQYYAPPLSDADFNKPIGKFSQSVFQCKTNRALTATMIGNLVIWHSNSLSSLNLADKKPLKVVKVLDSAIKVLTSARGYIVLGLANGQVKFFDQNLKIKNWYADFNFGPVCTIAFECPKFLPERAPPNSRYPIDATVEQPPFVIENFVIGTTQSIIAHITTDGSIAKIIHQDHENEVHGLAVHPTKPCVAVGGYSGLIKLWNYDTKEVEVSRMFDQNVKISCCEFSRDGCFLGVGTVAGQIYMLDTLSLEDTKSEPFHFSRNSITHLRFSADSYYMATADSDFTISLFRKKIDKMRSHYIYMARYKAHYKPIQELMFGVHINNNQPRLLSVGEDRVLVEYDLPNCSIGEIKIHSIDRIEQEAIPLMMMWYPAVNKEYFILVANDEYKFKMYNATTKMCRKTILGPTYSTPVFKMCPVHIDKSGKNQIYLAFANQNKVGLHILPLDGNPFNATSFIAHPSGITGLACSPDGKHLFTIGGKDEILHMWNIDTDALEAQAKLGGEDLVPFYSLLDGGREGEMFADLENYFYYTMLKSQGPNSMVTRNTSITIPLYQVPYVMRAMGFYPTELEIDNMINEVKYSEYIDTGKFIDEVDLGTFIKLFVNHRPVYGLSLKQLFNSFKILGLPTESGSIIERSELLEILQSKGEHMTVYELAEYITTLLGYNPEGGINEGHAYDPTQAGNIIDEHLPYQITADMFSEEILGFPLSKHLEDN